MTVEELLDSPVGRRMLEAAFPHIRIGGHGRDEAERVVSEILRVATDDTCTTCGGRPAYTDANAPCLNPDCKDGKVPPALVIR